MTTYDGNELATRFAALAPASLPADWADVLGRVGASQRAREGRRRRRLVIAFAVVTAIAAMAATAFAVRAYLDKGFVGLPPQGVAPSTPRNGTLVVSYGGRPGSLAFQGYIRPMHRVWVFADGRLIWDREGLVDAGGNVLRPTRQQPFYANLRKSGLLEQRLSREGVERLRSEVLSSGLFDHNRFLLGDYVTLWGWIDVREGGRLVRVQWAPTVHEETWPARQRPMTLKEKRVLYRLSARLAEPERWLPARAWRDKTIRAYVPAHYGACVWNEGRDQIDGAEIVRLLPRAVRERLRTRVPDAVAGSETTCFALRTDDARSAAKALDGAGLERVYPAQALVFDVPVRTQGRVVKGRVSFEALLPDGKLVCALCG